MARTSNVDATKPADAVKADKAELRANLNTIKTEINQLLRETGLAWKIAIGDLTV